MTVQQDVKRGVKGRTRILMTATVLLADGPQKVLVRDVSQHGAQIYDNRRISEGQDVCFKRGSVFVAARVAWSKRGIAGLQFYRPLTAAELREAFHLAVLGD